MGPGCAYLEKHRYCWPLVAAMLALVGLAACSNENGDVILPPNKGGDGTVIRIPSDGGVGGKAAGGAPGHGGGSGGSTATGLGGAVGSGGTGGASAGVGGMAGGGAGGAAGMAVVDDPCTACEKAKCGNPVNGFVQQIAAYQICFLGTTLTQDTVDAANCPDDSTSTALTATNGPSAGTAKTALCQALLKCIHQTNCNEGIDVDNRIECYCGKDSSGTVASVTECEDPSFVANGMCDQQVAAALELSQFAVSVPGFTNPCLANGAAFNIYDFCDANCCPTECNAVSASGTPVDTTFCNAPGTTGSGGATGTGGTTGQGGSSGTTGKGGSTGTGGATGTGGTTASGGSTGTGGATGTGGTGTGGSATGGTGAGGAPPSQLVTNGQFDTSTTGWTASFGAAISRSPSDSAGSAQSGSLDLALAGADPTLSVEAAASECAPAAGGTTYSMAAQAFVSLGSSSVGAVEVWFFASTDCSGALAGRSTMPTSATNGWQALKGTAQAPTGAHSASIRLELIKPIGPTAGEALFDAVSVTAQ